MNSDTIQRQMETARQTHLLLPEGTRVVTRAEARCFHGAGMKPPGAVGVVFQVPTDDDHAYLVRFGDGPRLPCAPRLNFIPARLADGSVFINAPLFLAAKLEVSWP
jgi:hypothetical protein